MKGLCCVIIVQHCVSMCAETGSLWLITVAMVTAVDTSLVISCTFSG